MSMVRRALCFWMMVVLVLPLVVPAPAGAGGGAGEEAAPDPQTALQLAHELHRLSMPGEKIVAMMEQVFSELHPDEPAGTWQTLEGRIAFEEKAKLSVAVKQIYTERLSAEQMREKIDFYKSAAGREELAERSLFESEIRSLLRQWMAPLAAELLAEREALEAELEAGGGLARQAQTVGLLRDVGQALMFWLGDQVGKEKRRVFESSTFAEGEEWHFHRKGREQETQTYRRVSHAEVVAALVPDYLDEVPREDAWGHAIQFAINRDLVGSEVISLRSAGRDGAFEGDDYEIGPHPRQDYDRDTVWADGYFVQWPEAIERLLSQQKE